MENNENGHVVWLPVLHRTVLTTLGFEQVPQINFTPPEIPLKHFELKQFKDIIPGVADRNICCVQEDWLLAHKGNAVKHKNK